MIVNIYLGILFGQLVIPRRPKSIETLEELVNQQEIEWAVTRGSAIYELFKESESSSIYGQLGARMRNVTSADEGVQQVVRSNRAFIRERSILTFKVCLLLLKFSLKGCIETNQALHTHKQVAQEHNRLRACRMQFGREDFYSVGFGLGLAKNSRYLKPFNSALTLMIENGFVAHWQSMYWPRRNQYTECKLAPTEGQPLTLKHFLSIYLVCTILTAISLLILVYQHLHEQIATCCCGVKSNKVVK